MEESPPQPKTRSDRTRERLLDAALTCFAHNGFARTTSRDIASEANVSLGLAYRYFRNKDQMVVAIVQRALAEVNRDIGTPPDPDQDPVESVVMRAFDTVRANPTFWRLFHQLRVHPAGSPAVDRLIRRAARQAREQMAQVLSERGVDCSEAHVAALFAAIDGAAQHFLLDPKTFPIDQVAAVLVRGFSDARSPDAQSS